LFERDFKQFALEFSVDVRELNLCTLVLKTQQIDVANVCGNAVTPFCNLNHRVNMAKKKAKTSKKTKKKTLKLSTRRGRPNGTGIYGCATTAVRIPKHLVDEVRKFIHRKIKSDTKSKESP
jgi:hypothetical protein